MIDGVSGPTKRVGKHNFEVRTDGFGVMTDSEVLSYKSERAERYISERILEIELRIAVLEEASDVTH